VSNERAFRWCRWKGHIELAKYLIHLGENVGYGKIDIHADDEYAFSNCCLYGHIEIAKFLIQLGENAGYGKINQKNILYI